MNKTLVQVLKISAALVFATTTWAAQEGTQKGMKVFNESMLDKRPKLESQVPPNYPFDMKRDGVGGTVVVDFIVTADGTIQNAFASKSDRKEFEAAAVQCVRKWKYAPGTKGGRAVNTRMTVKITFSPDKK